MNKLLMLSHQGPFKEHYRQICGYGCFPYFLIFFLLFLSLIINAHDSHAGPLAEEFNMIHHTAIDEVVAYSQSHLGRSDADRDVSFSHTIQCQRTVVCSKVLKASYFAVIHPEVYTVNG